MAEITAGMVKELRERTDAGMMDCKKALTEAGGDMARAVEVLQKNGKSKAAKAQGKVAADGAVSAAVTADGRTGVIVEVNCQTNFVARGDDFKKLVADVTRVALEHRTADVAAIAAVTVNGKTLGDRVEGLTARSGEKHAIRRAALLAVQGAGLVRSYIHQGARLGVLVEVASSAPGDARVADFADDVALQVASMNPQYLLRSDVPAEVVAKQREIFSAQMDKEDAETQAAPGEYLTGLLGQGMAEPLTWEAQPADFLAKLRIHQTGRLEEDGKEPTDDALDAGMREFVRASGAMVDNLRKAAEKVRTRTAQTREKILDGKVAKWLTEVVLMDQNSVKENKKSIGQVQAGVAAAVAGTTVTRFIRFELGEGVEKAPTKDFATEVAEMAAQHR